MKGVRAERAQGCEMYKGTRCVRSLTDMRDERVGMRSNKGTRVQELQGAQWWKGCEGSER